MSIWGDLMNEQRQREIEEAEEGIETDYFGEFVAWTCACIIIMLVGALGVFAYDHIVDRWRDKPAAPCNGTLEACRNIAAAIEKEAH